MVAGYERDRVLKNIKREAAIAASLFIA